jgi:hypothetical protein
MALREKRSFAQPIRTTVTTESNSKYVTSKRKQQKIAENLAKTGVAQTAQARN